MQTLSSKLILVFVLAITCLSFTEARAQSQHAQYSTHGPYNQDEQETRQERRAREREERREEDWQRHHQRYFGGPAIQPGPNESREAYRRRVHAQCNMQWDQCARHCNTIRDAYERKACVGNCNSDLNECKAGY